MKPIVLVTGYGGFLGQAVCRWLLSHGFGVRGVARQDYPALGQLGVETIKGDITNPETVSNCCRGTVAVIHTAALAGVWGKRSIYESINVHATRELLQKSQANGVRAFVYSSSPSVTFDGRSQSGVDESVPYPTRWLCDYPRTKAEAEKAVLASHDPARFATCSLRPHLIWGAGDPHLMPRIIQRCMQKRLRRVGGGTNLIDTVHVDAAAEAHGLALLKLLDRDPQVGGQAYFITDGEPVECWNWIRQILQGAGLEPPTRSISLNAAYRLGWMLEMTYRALSVQQEPPMTRFVALQLGVDHYFSIEKAKRELGYVPIGNRSAIFESICPWLESIGSNRHMGSSN